MPRLEAPAPSATRSRSRGARRLRCSLPATPEWPGAARRSGSITRRCCLWVRGESHALVAPRPSSRSSAPARRPATASTSRWSSPRNSPAAASRRVGRRLRHRRRGPSRRARGGRHRPSRCSRAASTGLPGRAREPDRAHRAAGRGRQRGAVRGGADEVAVPSAQPAHRGTRPSDGGRRGGVAQRLAQHGRARGGARRDRSAPCPVRSRAPPPPACHRLLREYGARCVTRSTRSRELLGGRVVRRRRPAGEASRRRAEPTDDATRVLDALSIRAWRDADRRRAPCGDGARGGRGDPGPARRWRARSRERQRVATRACRAVRIGRAPVRSGATADAGGTGACWWDGARRGSGGVRRAPRGRAPTLARDGPGVPRRSARSRRDRSPIPLDRGRPRAAAGVAVEGDEAR